MRIDRCGSPLTRLALVIGSTFAGSVLAATPAGLPRGYFPEFAPDTARIHAAISNSKLSVLPHSQLSSTLLKYDTGAMQPGARIASMTLLLKRSSEKQAQFDGYLDALTRPGSPYFHHWLTAEQVGTMFGPAADDLDKVKQWLASQGLVVKSVSPDEMTLQFSGSAAAVQDAFHTRIHHFVMDGQEHFGNLDPQQIPSALAPVVQGVASLSNFFPKPQHVDVGTVKRNRKTGQWSSVATARPGSGSQPTPLITTPPGTIDPAITYNVAPADFNQIYNVNPVWKKGMRGAGQTIVLLERTNVNPADIAAFRKAFLPADALGKVSIVHPADLDGESCPDPGINGDEGEAALDVEWAGAAAPDADIVLASCADSGALFGAFLAADLYQLPGSHGLPPTAPPIFSLSYGACELQDAYDARFADLLWSSLSAQGATVFVSSGDAGSAGCDQGASFAASYGPSPNGMASSTSSVAVGGTDFNDRGKFGQYWAPSNQALYQSALSYIPEQTWNVSCASSTLYGLLGYSDGIAACNDEYGQGGEYLQVGGGGGGASFLFQQPAWQEGVFGSSNHFQRTTPDISLFSANGLFGHALVYCMSDVSEGGTQCDYSNPDDVYFNSAGGTSFAAPAMAGVQALINQAVGDRSGNILPTLYSIASREYGSNGSPNKPMLQSCNSANGTSEGGDCVFNDVTMGDIVQPCFTGSLGCYSGTGSNHNAIGITEGSDGASQMLYPAWQTNTGYDQATGLGSVNVSNLVNAVVRYNEPFSHGNYVAPADFLDFREGFTNDGKSDIALMDPDGQLSSLAMKGEVVLYDVAQPSLHPGLRIGAIGAFAPSYDQLGLLVDSLAMVDPRNGLYLWVSTAQGGDFMYNAGTPYPAGWNLLGSAMTDSTRTQEMFWFNARTSQFSWMKSDIDLDTDQVVTTVQPAVSGVSGYVPTLADVNGDGYADIVWTSGRMFLNDVQLWINDRNGGYTKSKIAASAKNFTLFGAGDVDGDGKTDLIWTNPQTHQMTWWTMDGATVLAQHTTTSQPGASMVGVADYDGNRLADILWVDGKGHLTQWQSNGLSFKHFSVADAFGKPLVIPAGTQLQINRLQGSAIAGHH